MKLLLVFVIAIISIQAVPIKEVKLKQWQDFKTTHSKNYPKGEETMRRKIFLNRLELIEKHNQKYKKGLVTYKLAVNKFADFSNEELRQLTPKVCPPSAPAQSNFATTQNVAIPEAFDWRDSGAIGPIKQPEGCGSCWDFAVVGAIEPQVYIKKHYSLKLSEQNLLDCVPYDDCSTNWITNAYKYLIVSGGIDTETVYPYEGERGECRYDPSGRGAEVTTWLDLEVGNESDMVAAVASFGPVVVAIDASSDDFIFYSSGVYSNNETCSQTELNLGMVVVGYGSEEGLDYWIVRNAWGEGWGEEGYVRIARNADNTCGIASAASLPIIYIPE